MKVILNPGHCRTINPNTGMMYDCGAVDNGLYEAKVVWDVAKATEKYLIGAGVDVLDVVQEDDLQTICDIANESGADIFISIHCNAAASRQANGTETFCYNLGGWAERLAECVQQQIVTSLDILDRGVKTANFYVLRNTLMPAILVELGFVSNQMDAELLRYAQDDFARAIARGVTDYELEVANE